MKTNNENTQEINLERLLLGLQKEDSRNLQLTIVFMRLMWVLAPLYLLLAIIAMVTEKTSLDQLGLVLFAAGFFAFGLLFKILNMDYKSVDYGVATTEMLRNAADRYRFWQMKTYLTIVPILLICFATSFSLQRIVPNPDLMIRLAIVFIGYFFIICIAVFIGYLIWRSRQKPLRDRALALLSEIER